MINALESARETLASIHPQLPVATLAVLVGGLIWLVKVVWPEGFAKLPKKAQAYPALVLGAVLGALSGTGDPMTILADALFGGLLGGVTAVGGHHAGKRLRGAVRSSAVAAMLVVALSVPALTSCDLFLNKIPASLAAQFDKWGPQGQLMFDLLCGRSEAAARGRVFRGVEEDRDFVDDVCRSEEAIATYGPLVEQALTKAEGRAMARATRRAERSE